MKYLVILLVAITIGSCGTNSNDCPTGYYMYTGNSMEYLGSPGGGPSDRRNIQYAKHRGADLLLKGCDMLYHNSVLRTQY